MGFGDILFENLVVLIQEMCQYYKDESKDELNKEIFLRVVEATLRTITESDYPEGVELEHIDWRKKAKEFIQREIDEWKEINEVDH